MCHFLQARPLPAKMFNAPPMEFPANLEPIYECPAEGVCDQVLDVLNVYGNNNDKEGFVVYTTTWLGSLKLKEISEAMPKKGAAMILCAPQEPGRGHIETLALERGVTLLFHDHQSHATANPIIAQQTRKKIFDCLGHDSLGLSKDFAGHKKVRIVANGETARIYAVE